MKKGNELENGFHAHFLFIFMFENCIDKIRKAAFYIKTMILMKNP